MKDQSPDSIDGLLIKVILREASPEEGRWVEEWVASHESNRQYFEHFKIIWEESRALAVESVVDEEEAWTRFRQRVAPAAPGSAISNPSGSSGPAPAAPASSMPMPRRVVYSWLRIAAAFFVVTAGAWLYYTYSYRPSQVIELRSANTIRTDTLSDGTVVTLNRNSTLTAKKYFDKESRSVELKGEAFFSVTPDKDRPFAVRADGADIHVLGTSFNVKTSPQATEVIVETGLVELGKDRHFIPVRPHEKALLPANSDSALLQDNPDQLYNYYRTQTFNCNGTPLSRLVEVLNEAYDSHIVIADARLNNLPLTTVFHDQSVDEILDIVAHTFKITVLRKDGQILLKQE